MSRTDHAASDAHLREAHAAAPTGFDAAPGAVVQVGRSKELRVWSPGVLAVRLLPTLRSITHAREEVIPGTEVLRLDFFELVCRQLAASGVDVAFLRRLSPDTYLARWCRNPPVEVIVKMEAVGSVLRDYPGLFTPGQRFREPVVRFDLRTEPRDIPIPEDYVRELGERPDEMRRIALRTTAAIQRWLGDAFDLVDICYIMGRDSDGTYRVTSEVSPDGMRLRDRHARSRDKDLFRAGAPADEILDSWRRLIDEVRALPVQADHAGRA